MRIKAHAKAEERVFVYCYCAGHGCSNVRQWFICDTSDEEKTLYNIEEKLRMLSLNGRGFAFIFATYDICRLTSDFENLKKLMAKSDSQELKAALK